MAKIKNKWLSRALSCALAVTLMAGTAVMTPVADIVGTNITAEALEESGVIYVPSEVNMSDITEGGFMLCRGMTIHNNTEDEISYKGYDDEDAEGLNAFGSFVTYSGNDLVIPADGAFSAAKIQKVERKKDSTSASGYSRTLCLFRCNSVAVVIASDKEIGCLEAGDRVSKGSSFHNTSSNAIEVEYTLADDETINTMIPADSTVTFDKVYNVTYVNTNGDNLRLEEYVPTRYTVNWRNYNGDILKTDHVIADTIPYYTGDTPQKEPDSDGTEYIFKSWNPTVKAIKADIDYTATYGRAVAFQENVIVYNGDVLSITGTVMLNKRPLSKKDHPISVEWSYGSYYLSISGSSYPVTGDYCGDADDVGVKFQPSGTKNNYKLVAVPAVYTVTWVDGDGNVIKTDSVEYGTAPVYDGEKPTKAPDENGKPYYFVGWKADDGTFYDITKNFPAVSENVTYTAVFKQAVEFEQGNTYHKGDIIGVSKSTYWIGANGKDGRNVGGRWYHNHAFLITNVSYTPDWSPNVYRFGPSYVFDIKDLINGGTDTIIVYAYKVHDNAEDAGLTVFGYYESPETHTMFNKFSEHLGDIDESFITFVNSTDGTPEIVLTYPVTGEILTQGTDYKVEYNGGNTAAVIGIGRFSGELQVNCAVLPREMKSSVTNRRKAGNNAKATLSGEWYLPKNATNIQAGIARLSTDDTAVTNYDVYKNGVKKASALKTTSGKYSFSLLVNSTHANQNLYTVTYVTYEIDGVPFVSISKAFTGYPNPA